jgi:hypothetical protein
MSLPSLLENRWLKAEFDPATGVLLRLADAGGADLVAGCWCGYTREGGPVSENPDTPAERFAVQAVRIGAGFVESVMAHDGVEIRRRFELPAGSPMLKVRVAVRALRFGVQLLKPVALPGLVFSAGFVDPFEDGRDLYFDGEELGDGRELPPWRVFFREGRANGLLVAARSKLEMGRLQIVGRGFAVKPHILAAYTTDFVRTQSPLAFGERGDVVHEASFEIGPWREAEHGSILGAAGLDQPDERRNPPLTGESPGALKGLVFRAVDFAPADAVSDRVEPGKWLAAAMPNCTGGRALFCGCTVKAPPVALSPGLEGVYRVYAGIGNGNGVLCRFSADPQPLFRMPREPQQGEDAFPRMNPFLLRLSGAAHSRELFLKTARLDGQTLTFSKFPNSYAATVLDYVRFERLTPGEEAAWEAEERAGSALELSGFNDIPDIAWLTDPADPDVSAYAANLWEHANCGVRKVYWRIDGQCSDYPSKVNTMRYVSARVHGNFTPQCKAYGRALRKTDMLKLAVEAARAYGLTLYGWMRFNNYSGNVQSDFFVRHPEYHEANDKGWALPKLCLAHEAVRRHKIDILCEAAAYGLAGVNLGFLRHPPVLQYAPVLVEGFRRKFGEAPPPEPAKADAERVQTHPDENELRAAWYRYRAGFLTQFGRELRASLRETGQGNVKVSIWVRHDRCLYDGIDLDAWLDEGLCDEVVASSARPHGILTGVSPDWVRKVRERVPLIATLSAYDLEGSRRATEAAMQMGLDGVCTYESDFSVTDDAFIEFYRSLRK